MKIDNTEVIIVKIIPLLQQSYSVGDILKCDFHIDPSQTSLWNWLDSYGWMID